MRKAGSCSRCDLRPSGLHGHTTAVGLDACQVRREGRCQEACELDADRARAIALRRLVCSVQGGGHSIRISAEKMRRQVEASKVTAGAEVAYNGSVEFERMKSNSSRLTRQTLRDSRRAADDITTSTCPLPTDMFIRVGPTFSSTRPCTSTMHAHSSHRCELFGSGLGLYQVGARISVGGQAGVRQVAALGSDGQRVSTIQQHPTSLPRGCDQDVDVRGVCSSCSCRRRRALGFNHLSEKWSE